MNKKVLEALKLIKNYCLSHEMDCRGCDLFVMEHGEPMCYLMDRVPEEVDVEALEEDTEKDYYETLYPHCRGCDFFTLDKGEKTHCLLDREPEDIED